MGKILILILIILISFWVGRLSVRTKKDKVAKRTPNHDSSIIDVELEDEP
ncbi:MAG: hypothetical protein IH875_01385 [Candidatus Dadabacteria bacterium]|nr:hypothetical protein [Candidatus Dadabacteria bacterium]